MAWGASPNQRLSRVWIDWSKEYCTSSDPWPHVDSIDKGIIQLMMIEEAPREDHHCRSHLPDYHEDYSGNLNHPLVFDFLSNTVNMVDSKEISYLMSRSLKNETRSHEDSSFTVSTSLKNETTPFPNRVFDYGLIKSKSRLSKISEVNHHSNHRVEYNEPCGACNSICVIMLGACKLIMRIITVWFKLIKK